MTQLSMFDPFSLWKSMYDYTEESMSTWVDEALQTETYAEWMGQIQSAFLQYQKIVHNTTDIYLKHLNLPTRDEISNIASLIINVEEKLENLDEKVEDELINDSFSEEIIKLKSSLFKLDKKIDQLLKLKENSL